MQAEEKIKEEEYFTAREKGHQIVIVLSGQAYLNFVNAIKSSATRKLYDITLKRYMRFIKATNVEDLLLSSSYLNQQQIRLIEAKVIEFIIHLRDVDKISHSLRNAYFCAINLFYSMNDITLNKHKIGRYMGGHTRTNKDRAFTHQEIATLLNFCDERTKAVVLLLASSGVRVGAIPCLLLKNLKENTDYKLYKITVYDGTTSEYITFCTPEATVAIKNYLEYRKRCGEILTENSLLFREQYDKNDVFNINRPQMLRAESIGKLITDTLDDAGILGVRRLLTKQEKDTVVRAKIRKEIARCNGFRKFVNTNFVRAKVDPIKKEMLLGHKRSLGLDVNYYRPNEDELLQEYLKAVDYLTIDNEHRLQRKVVELTQKQDDIELMKAEQRRKDLELREQMQQQQQQYQRMIEEFQDRDRKENEELRREITGT